MTAAEIYAFRHQFGSLAQVPSYRRGRSNAEFIAAEVAAGRLVAVKVVDDAGWTITEFQKPKGAK